MVPNSRWAVDLSITVKTFYAPPLIRTAIICIVILIISNWYYAHCVDTVVHKIVQFLPLPINCLLLSESFQSRIYNVHLHMYLITCSIVVSYQLHFVLFKCSDAGMDHYFTNLCVWNKYITWTDSTIYKATLLICWLRILCRQNVQYIGRDTQLRNVHSTKV